ncbi:MAG: NAD-dependent epimerase/dehydratase family protein [Lachnospiraceae bacterium]|nr:NAD-dependent epimerase/dehydratase family protein [Lachnospiraceae bacterium]
MRNKVLILGAAGFIGTNLTLRLLLEKKQLVLFDRREAQFDPKVCEAVRQGKAEFLTGQFLEDNWKMQANLLREVDMVYHLVSTTCPTNSNQDAAREMEENVIATMHFLDACVEHGVRKVIFLSSGGTVYGKEHTGICKEEEEAFPITVYGVQKLTIEKILYLYWQMHGLDYRIVRLSNPYGPYQRPNGIQGVVTTFTWKALHDEPILVYGDGSVVRDYIYIDDAVEGILRIAEQQGNHRLYNLGSGRGRTVDEVIQTIARVLQKQMKVSYQSSRAVDVPVNVLDVSRFKQDFGGFLPIELEEGIQRLASFFKEQDRC